MSSQPATYLTPEEYLEIERAAERKSEYYNGQMYAMAGASPRHVLIVSDLVIAFGVRLRNKPSRLYSTDLRVRITRDGFYAYPDVVVICGDPLFADQRKDTALNPLLIVEVLSPSTQDYDRGQKFEFYRALPTLMEYLTVGQDRPHVEDHTRQSEGWLLTEYSDLSQTVHLASLNVSVPLSEIYDKVEFDQ